MSSSIEIGYGCHTSLLTREITPMSEGSHSPSSDERVCSSEPIIANSSLTIFLGDCLWDSLR